MKHNILLGLAVAGLLFSGYVSGIKLFTDTCAFNEGCPYFFGYPACYFGFGMYLVLTVLLLLAQRGMAALRPMLQGVLAVSVLGIFFAGYFTLAELPRLANEGLGAYLLGLPTCAYGLIVYLAIFGVALAALLERRENSGR